MKGDKSRMSAAEFWATYSNPISGRAYDRDYGPERCRHEWCVEQGEDPKDDREVCMLCGAEQYPYRED